MDQQLHHSSILQSVPPPNPPANEFLQPPPDLRLHSNGLQANSGQRQEVELKDSVASRKVQKADREKLRRDRLNDQFVELGNVLDPDRPKNDKGTILADTIHLLKDLTDEVIRLKSDYSTLTEESRELTQEKNDLREEKASLKSDIEDLNVQYQQRLRSMFPWTAIDQSVVMAPPSYPYPVAVPMPPAPIPMHASIRPYPFFGHQNPGVVPNPCSTFVPYITPNTLVEQQSTQYMPTTAQPGSRSRISGKQESRIKLSGFSKVEKCVDSSDVTTDLELKTPGSTADQELSSIQRKSKKPKENSNQGSSSSRCSTSPCVQNFSPESIVDRAEAKD